MRSLRKTRKQKNKETALRRRKKKFIWCVEPLTCGFVHLGHQSIALLMQAINWVYDVKFKSNNEW